MPQEFDKGGAAPGAYDRPTIERQRPDGRWAPDADLSATIRPPRPEGLPPDRPAVARAPIGDVLRDLAGDEHAPEARQAAAIPDLRKVSVALDQVVNRTADHLREHPRGHGHGALRRANDGDLDEARKQARVLRLAADAADAMIARVADQLADLGPPPAEPAPTPGGLTAPPAGPPPLPLPEPRPDPEPPAPEKARKGGR